MKALHYCNKIIRAVGYTMATSFCKKNKKLWVFGAWKGTAYNDNTKYLFEYVAKNEPDITAVWITKNSDVYNHIKSLGYKVELWPEKEAKKAVRHAGFMFQTEGNRDIGEFPVGRTHVIQLWHGISMKRLDSWNKSDGKIKKFLISLYAEKHQKSIWCVASDFVAMSHNEMMNIPMKQFRCTGNPRDDVLVNKAFESQASKHILDLCGDSTPVAYFPTHRNFGKDFDPDFVIDGLLTLDKAFGENKLRLFYKPHPNEAKMLKEAMCDKRIEYRNIHILTDRLFDDVYEYLHVFKCLITDYSSVAYDFLCLERPIVYFNYDLQKYIDSDAGILPVYYEYQAGPFVDDWISLAETIISTLSNNENDIWKEKREKCQMYVNPFNDGGSCKRIVETLRKEFM